MENLPNYVATPKLGFGEAVKKVLSNIINLVHPTFRVIK